MEQIKEFFKEVKLWLNEMKFLAIISIRLWMAKKLADYRHVGNNRRYFVFPDGHTGKMMVFCRDELKVLKKNKYVNPNIGYLEASERCFYMTSTQNNSKIVTPEEKEKFRKNYEAYLKIIRPFLKFGRFGTPKIINRNRE